MHESIKWELIETARPDVLGPKVLAAARHTKNVHYVWPSQLSELAVNGETYFKYWAHVTHPDMI